MTESSRDRHHQRMRGAGALRAVLLLALCALPMSSSACNVVAPIAYIIEGPPSRDAVFILPKKKTVVFVDDRRNVIRMNARGLRQRIADTLTQELLDRRLLTDMILPRDAMGVAQSRDRYGELLSVEEIARAVEAEQLIYVRVTAFTESVDGMSPNPSATVEVRIMDLQERAWIFPSTESGDIVYPVQVIMPAIDPQVLRVTSTRLQVHQALADAIAVDIAKLFYKHEIKELGGRLGTR